MISYTLKINEKIVCTRFDKQDILNKLEEYDLKEMYNMNKEITDSEGYEYTVYSSSEENLNLRKLIIWK